jgi:L,D-transpeptidase YcbB
VNAAGMRVFILNAITILLLVLQVTAQISPESLRQFITDKPLSSLGIQNEKQVREFYNSNRYQLCWIEKEKANNLQILSRYIQHASPLGLKSQDYQPALLADYLAGFPEGANEHDSLIRELRFTDAAIHFIHDVLMGNMNEPIGYNGLDYSPSCYNTAALLNVYLANGRFSSLLTELESKDAAYLSLKKESNFFRQMLSAASFKDVVVQSTKVNDSNLQLISRLRQLGFIDADTGRLTEPELKVRVKQAQNLFGLLNDGVLRSTTMEAFNVPLTTRVEEIIYTLNCLRWLACIKQQGPVIVVNIPSATLLLYKDGKRSTPTPTLCSKITEVVLYPYWNVPNKIAVKELLPVIKRHPRFLSENNYQVLDKNGKVTNPLTINWQSLSRSNFPYVIRQSTGCDNSLGLIKLNFYNPYTVYLHDTPDKYLFSLNKRYFSHGCMRLEQAVEVVHYVLKENRIAVDTLMQKGCLKNQAPIPVPASEKIPVFVLYHTAWFNSTARLIFHEDVYNKFHLRKK